LHPMREQSLLSSIPRYLRKKSSPFPEDEE
jgi:hypothetical protein